MNTVKEILEQKEGTPMDRRTFFKSVAMAGGAALLVPSVSNALQFFPHAGKQKWAVLYGSRYGSARDAGIWISEGMGAIADVFDARENPDLSRFDNVIVGSGIYASKIDKVLEAYLAKNAQYFSSRIKALYIVCGATTLDNPKTRGFAQGFVDALSKACGTKPPSTKIFPGRLTIRLLNAEDYKIREKVAKSLNQPLADYDRLPRKDCLDFGAEILAKA